MLKTDDLLKECLMENVETNHSLLWSVVSVLWFDVNQFICLLSQYGDGKRVQV